MKYLITSFLIIVSINGFSQWYVEIAGGMNFPVKTSNDLFYFNTTSLHDEINNEYYETKKEPINFNVIKCPSFSIKAGYLLNNKYEFGLNLIYANSYFFRGLNQNNRTISKYIVRNSNQENSTETIITDKKSYYSEILSGNLFGGYTFSLNNNFSITPVVGVNLKVVNIKRIDSLITKRYYYDTGENFSHSCFIEKSKFPFTYKIKNLINFSIGINSLYVLNENFTLSFNSMINIFNNEYLPETQIKYYEETIIDGETIQINNDEQVYNLQMPSESFFLNTFNFSLGIRYYFGATKNNDNDK